MTDLDKLEELERAATPGEWKADSDREYVFTETPPTSLPAFEETGTTYCVMRWPADCDGLPEASDLSLVLALRNNAPAMIAELRELRADVEGLSARLATAREALEEARHSIEHTYFCQNDSAETGCTCNALYAQNKIANALKKTTKGGGA